MFVNVHALVSALLVVTAAELSDVGLVPTPRTANDYRPTTSS